MFFIYYLSIVAVRGLVYPLENASYFQFEKLLQTLFFFFKYEFKVEVILVVFALKCGPVDVEQIVLL